MQAGGAEDDVLVQPLQIVRPQAELAAHFFQLVPQGSQRGPVLFIAGGHIDPGLQQQVQQRLVADADPDDGCPFSFQCIQIFVQGHGSSSLFHFYSSLLYHRAA